MERVKRSGMLDLPDGTNIMGRDRRPLRAGRARPRALASISKRAAARRIAE
jgi:hypothetical protein